MVIKLTNSNSKLEFHTLPSDDPQRRQPDIALAMEKLKWRPTVELKEGLQKTIDDFAPRVAEIQALEKQKYAK
jgi:UDP-glucuronate decarboxylase